MKLPERKNVGVFLVLLMVIVLVFGAALVMLCGCGVVPRVELLRCDDNGGVHSYHAHGSDLEVTCKDGTVYNVAWL